MSEQERLPEGWPEGVTLPTLAEVEEALREGREQLRQQLADIRRKSLPVNHCACLNCIVVGGWE